MDQKIKQRLTGAVVLVALVVIFVPIILEGPDNEWTPRSHSMPEQPEMDYRASMELEIPQQTEDSGTETDGVISKTLNLPGPSTAAGHENASTTAPSAPAESPITTPPQATAAKPLAPAKPIKPVKPVKPVKQVKHATPPAKKKSTPEPVIKGWFVQVGSFGEEMNATGLRDRLKKAGYESKLHKAGIGGGYAYRVLVGPSSSRAGAEQNATRLKSGLQLSGMVIEYP